MKKVVLLIALVMLLKPVLPVLDYVFEYDYISQKLCINKAKPKLHCNGKCHLMKEMAKASESDKPISSDKKATTQESEILFFEQIATFNLLSMYFQNKHKINADYSNSYFYLNSCSVFHPPTIIA